MEDICTNHISTVDLSNHKISMKITGVLQENQLPASEICFALIESHGKSSSFGIEFCSILF